MLRKLVKYDFKSLFKTLIPIYLIGILVAVFTRVANIAASKVSLLQVPAGLITSLCVIIIIGIPIATFIISVIRYYNSMIKDEGYLTHTLPVKKSSLVLSQLITSVTVMFTALLASIIVLLVAFKVPSNVFEGIRDLLSNVDVLFVVLVIITLILNYISQLIILYAAIALGQKHSGNKMVYAVVYGIVLYNINQVVSAIILFIPALFNNKYIKFFEQDNLPMEAMNYILIFSIVLTSLFIVAYYFVTTKTLEKKLNLD